MNLVDILDKAKSKLVTLVVFVATLIMLFNLYQNQNEQINKINQMQNIEIKKSALLKNMQLSNQELEAYKILLSKVLEDSVISSLSDFAKNVGVQVESFKPETKIVKNDYIEFPFTLSLKAKGYHDLAKFVSKIENYSQVFIITNADISSEDRQGNDISARLSLSNIVFRSNENENK